MWWLAQTESKHTNLVLNELELALEVSELLVGDTSLNHFSHFGGVVYVCVSEGVRE